MKYTIELTDNQKKQMDLLCELAHRYIGFNPKLEPVKTTNVEDTNEYQIGYKVGFEDGKADAIYNTDLIDGLKQVEYTKGYNSAINDYNAMIQWLHDCTDDYKEFMNKKYGYDIMYLTNPKVDEGVMLYDLICDHDMAEVISEFQKWKEEKKKAEEEIGVGDEVITSSYNKAIVTFVDDEYVCLIFSDGSSGEFRDEDYKKTGRHFEEVEQLLNKLRGE